MRATVMYGAGDVRVEDVPDARLIEPTDALVRVSRAAICGSDLWPYKSMEPTDSGRRMGHEFIGVIEAAGSDVETVERGDLVLSPFLWSDGTCVFCQEGLQSECLHGGRYGWATSMAGRARRYASRKQTGRSSYCRSARTTRSCRRCSHSLT
jgi:threonine dehydrogenase-like Zn-dependent dehydrogenase